MPIYEKPVRLLMRDMVADLSILPGATLDKGTVISWFAQKYPLVKEGTVKAHLVLLSINNPGRVHHTIKPDGTDDLFYQLDPNHFRLYEPKIDPIPITKRSSQTSGLEDEDNALNEAPSDATKSGQASTFAYERDLRNYLAKNLNLIEPGLKLYEEENISGVEFPVGGRFVDILAVDNESNYVVIELKVSRGYDRVVGQLLRYMAWIGQHHADPGQNVRGIIIAQEITGDLKLACSRLVGVTLYEYELAVTLKKAV